MKRFKDILFVAEPGQDNQAALARAVTLAENNQASLTLVDVMPRIGAGIGMPDGGPISAELQAAMTREHEERLTRLAEPFRDRIAVRIRVLRGTPFLEVVREVLRGGHDLVIKPPELEDWVDRLLGSDDMHLLRKCPCPVWMVKPGAPKAYRRILAAVDVDEAKPGADGRRGLNQQILQMAGSLALAEFAELHVVHVWDAPGESTMRGAMMRVPEQQVADYVDQVRRGHERAIDKLLEETAAKLGGDTVDYLNPEVHMVRGWPRRDIPALARRIDADLIVMGTVGRTGIPGFIMGNTAETILGQIDCSVLAIKPPGFVTPVTLEEGP